ncbi:MAG: lipopolysaccharide biosynthesis protein, partial [Planctomycetota bacterium]
RNSLVLMVLAAATMALLIKPIIFILYGEAFIPAAKIFYAMAPGVVLWPFAHFLGVHVAASGKPKSVFFASLYVLGLAVGLCWLLIPKYGMVGAGLSMGAIHMIRAFSHLLVYTKNTKASFSEVIIPQKSDLLYYRHILKLASSAFTKKVRLS